MIRRMRFFKFFRGWSHCDNYPNIVHRRYRFHKKVVPLHHGINPLIFQSFCEFSWKDWQYHARE